MSHPWGTARRRWARSRDAGWSALIREETPAEIELRLVLDSVRSGVLVLEHTGRIAAANDRLRELLGITAEQFQSVAHMADLEKLVEGHFRVPDSFGRRFRAFGRTGHAPERDELELIRPVRRVLGRTSRPLVGKSGWPFGWLEIYEDITRERTVHSNLFQTEKMAALGQLVSGIAHELNNPLTGIMGYAQLLLGHGLAPEQLAEASRIYAEAERARHIVKNLLFFAREAKLERTRVNINEVVERAVALRSYELKVENIAVELDFHPEPPATMADPHQLQQVILNLLINAEQALCEAKGAGRVTIRTRQSPTGRLSIEVADDGPGIPPEIASRVFDPFFTTKPPGVGTGLGLSIVYGIVHEHDGEVFLESQPGRGTKITLELPVVIGKVSETQLAPPNVSQARLAASSRILVVEDEPTVAQLIRDVLSGDGHHVEVSLDSHEALQRISHGAYDLVICDLRMPRLDGAAFYDALVRSGSPIQRKIIFTTGDTLSPRTLEFLEPRRLPYLAKPFLVEELKLAVNRLLQQRFANLESSGENGLHECYFKKEGT